MHARQSAWTCDTDHGFPWPIQCNGMQAGIDFDRIWAWEVSAQEPQQYWDAVPDTYKQR